MAMRWQGCRRLLSVLIGLFIIFFLNDAATSAEFRFVASLPSTDQPVWQPTSVTIDLRQAADEDITLVLDNPTGLVHGFAAPGLHAVVKEKITGPPAQAFLPEEMALQYTSPILVMVAPQTTQRIRLSGSGFKAHHIYAEIVPFFCPVHKESRAGSIYLVK